MEKRTLTAFVLVFICLIIVSPSFAALVAQPKSTLQQITVNKMTVSTSTISVSGTIYGLPLDGTGHVPVQGANVTIVGGKIIGGITFAIQKGTPSNANGYYSFSDIPIGLFLVVARKPGEYLPGFRFVRLTSSQPFKHNQDITMIRAGGGGDGSVEEYMMTLLADEQMLLQQYMNTLSVEEKSLMQQSMIIMITNQ